MHNYLKNSKIILLFVAIRDRHISFKIYISNLYKYSYIYSFVKRINGYFGYSFLSSTVNKIYYLDIAAFLDDSKFIKSSLGAYNLIKYNVPYYSDKSIIMKMLNRLREGFYLFPLRASGIILSCAVLTKLLLELALNREISRLNISASIFFLFLGFIFLVSMATWEDLKTSSRFLKSKK